MNQLAILTAALALSISAPAFAHDLGDLEGDNSPNSMGIRMCTGPHMTVTQSRPQTPQDVERAHDVIDTLRRALAKYRDSRVALAEGYQIFLPTVPQEVYHFTDYSAAQQEYMGHFDPRFPGSLLYVKNSAGDYVLIGAMYSAPADATPDELDALIPLSVAHWHAHTNICLPNGITLNDVLRGDVGASRIDEPGMLPVSSSAAAPAINQQLGFLADGRFGFTGKISDASTCEAAGGHLLKQAFGWMVHVYPFNGDDLKVAFGMSVPKASTN
ncbi:hypothetical protein [Candidatus Binatus sp.]|uniref:hypothetical protein n=1 Tax=Candidatus Binatus sp. TaxID=2811406 RepID=UPI003C814788